ncbi:MAG: [FeFe] hydrogenase H-cluster radical SAM maturase HydG [Phycisphaerae bacterium]|jgi:2-iminoacetate synthase|nr:[FeFe] hydrogenase H-cluster radical SAM maturase HydG [Phycisphaerae bacterium]
MCPITSPKLSEGAVDFIDEGRLSSLLAGPPPQPQAIGDIIAKSLAKEPLSVAETSALLRCEDPELIEEIFQAARTLKRNVYGNRIVLFAPLYIGNDCVNDCMYCAFRRSNAEAIRRTLTPDEITAEVTALEDRGHKRLILVFGEHPRYDAEFMARTVRQVYSTTSGRGEIRRVNINAAPLDHDGYKVMRQAGIGTYQVFQETYHHGTFAEIHPSGTRKSDYLWRLDSLNRAMEAGCDDVGIGALFGLYDWRFEVLGLVSHAVELHEKYGVGPHTISFPRLQPAHGISLDRFPLVNDEDFVRLVAVLRLAVPYTGLILTARENAEIRRRVMEFGVSQIDAGSRIELGGYAQDACDTQSTDREQFELGDVRSLDGVMRELLTDGYVPSFCTACYRLGRTGEHFMEFAIPGFIKRFCTPNALTTLMEYLVDYASPKTRQAGLALVETELEKIPDSSEKADLLNRLEQIRTTDKRDLYL